ncbi:MAG: hypothetical protein KBD01_16060 [Acidobacteria bacterium]|nr:hypothetical protein [Acidobacteriota bacterium]
MKPTRTAVAAILFGSAVWASLAAGTETWRREGKLLRAGTLDGMMVSPAGALVPGLATEELGRPGVSSLWDVVAVGDDVFVAAGEGRGVLRFRRGKDPEPVGGLGKDPEVFALAAGPAGSLYAATGPSGAVYRIDTGTGKGEEIFRPDATYIWDLLALPDGALIVATGLPGTVVRIEPTRARKVIWETSEPHVRTLALGPDGKVLAGTAGSGLLVELDGRGKGFVLWDSARPETVAIETGPGGTIWAAFAGSPGTDSGGAAEKPRRGEPRESGGASITVRPRDEEEGEKETPSSESGSQLAKASELPAGGGDVVRIAPAEEPETIWSDGKETPLDLLLVGNGRMLLATGSPARLWWFDADGREGLWDARADVRTVSALAQSGGRTIAVTSNPAAVVAYGPGPAKPARWVSDVIDSKVRSRFGRVFASVPAEAANTVRVDVRAGNTSEPGPGWTGWVPARDAAGPPGGDGGAPDVPASRFYQVRVEIDAQFAGAPAVPLVEARYRPANRAPRIDSVDVLPQGVAYRALPPPPVASGEVPVVPPPRGPDSDRVLGEAAGNWRPKKVFESDALTVTWTAKDADDDALQYRLEYCADRGGVCERWTQLADALDQNFFSFDSRLLPDGVYRFRVTATDQPDNVAGAARTDEKISEPFRVDHVLPVFERVEVRHAAEGRIEVRVEAADPQGRLAEAAVSNGHGALRSLAPSDGVADSAREVYTGVVDAPPDGQLVLLQLTDAAGNVATKSVSPTTP